MADQKSEIATFVWTTIVGAIGGIVLLIGVLLLWLAYAARWSDKYVVFAIIGVGAVLLTISIAVSRQQSSRIKSKKP